MEAHDLDMVKVIESRCVMEAHFSLISRSRLNVKCVMEEHDLDKWVRVNGKMSLKHYDLDQLVKVTELRGL